MSKETRKKKQDDNSDDSDLEDEEEEAEENEDEEENDDDESDDDDENDEDEELLNRIVSELETRLGDRFDSIADKRVNAILKEVRKDDPKKGKKSKDSEDEPAQGDARLARISFRDALADDFKPLGSEEREFVSEFGKALIEVELRNGGDEDEVGRKVAKSVVKQVTDYRKFIERTTKARLKKKGLLAETPGQHLKGGKKTGDSAYSRGAELAKQRYAAPTAKT